VEVTPGRTDKAGWTGLWAENEGHINPLENHSVMAMSPPRMIGAPRWGRPWEGWP